MPAGIKKTAQERLARRERIESLLAQDVGRSRIARMVAGEFGVSTRMARKDLAEIEAEWAADQQAIPGYKLRSHRKKVLEALYRKCLATGDLRAAVVVQDKLCKIDGVYAPEVVGVVGGLSAPEVGASTLALPTSHQRGRLAELLERAQADRARLPAPGGVVVEAGASAPRARDRAVAGQPAAQEEDEDDEPAPEAHEAAGAA